MTTTSQCCSPHNDNTTAHWLAAVVAAASARGDRFRSALSRSVPTGTSVLLLALALALGLARLLRKAGLTVQYSAATSSSRPACCRRSSTLWRCYGKGFKPTDLTCALALAASWR